MSILNYFESCLQWFRRFISLYILTTHKTGYWYIYPCWTQPQLLNTILFDFLRRAATRDKSNIFLAGMSFDPVLILYQIVALQVCFCFRIIRKINYTFSDLQCLYYVGMTVIFEIFFVAFDLSLKLDRIFQPNLLDLANLEGWMEATVILIASLVGYGKYIWFR